MRRLWLLLTAIALAVTACSGDDGGAAGFGFNPAPDDPTVSELPPPTESAESGGLTGSDAILIDRFTPSDYVSADGSFRSVQPDTEPWFEFFPDGSMIGHDGCNSFDATFIVSGGYTEFGTTVTTDDDGQIIAMGNFEPTSDALCSDAVTEQAADLTAALDAANRWVGLDPSFILRDSRGGNSMVATATP